MMGKELQMRFVLLHALVQLGGRATKKALLDFIDQKRYWVYSDTDLLRLRSRTELRWRNQFAYTRAHLIAESKLEPRHDGLWVLTEEGSVYYNWLKDSVLHSSASDREKISETCLHELSFQYQDAHDDEELIRALASCELSEGGGNACLQACPLPKGPVREGGMGVRIYARDAHIAINALRMAGYTCAINPEHATFIRRRGNTPYMEPHHLIPISETDRYDVSLDREQNIVSLCSHCHNQIHYGTKDDIRNMLKKLFAERKEGLCDILGRTIEIEELWQLFGVL